jgi:DNA-directed RNA polymerase subunit alpha
MEKIALPKKIEFKQSKDADEGLVIVEPLYPGYGNTIGNSLRRILLSSLPGSAVVGAKIKGARHEFMSLPGVKEDVVDIILNLKDLKLKILSETEEPIKLELNAKGKKKVTASDIKKDSNVEIINEDLVLANITDAIGNLSMEIYVSQGRGYRLVERDKKNSKEVDYIDIDSIFSPVVGASYKVENVRVGKMTNWDRLVLEVKTDGSISVEDSFNQAVEILIDQFNALFSPEKKEEKVKSTDKKEEKAKGKKKEEVKKEEKKEKKKVSTKKSTTKSKK